MAAMWGCEQGELEPPLAARCPFRPTSCIERKSMASPAPFRTNSPRRLLGCWVAAVSWTDGTKRWRQSRELNTDPLGQETFLLLYKGKHSTWIPIFQCLCMPEFAIASHHHQSLPLPGHPKYVIHAWSCPREDGLGSHAGQTGERCWYHSSSGGMTTWFISSQILPDVNCRSSLGREPYPLI